MGNTAKTDNFLRAIRRHVSAQKKQMLNEVSQIKEETLTLTRTKAQQDSEKLIADRLEQKRTEQTSILAKKTQDGQRALFRQRAEMTNAIFDKATQKLIAYTQTPEYLEGLLKSTKKIAGLFAGNDCVLYVSEKDLEHADEMASCFDGNAVIKADKTIKIGGVKGYCKAKGIVADETLDSKLQLQREWFIENAQLNVL